MLKNSAMKMNILDDFLIDEEIYDIPIIEDTLAFVEEEEDDIKYTKSTYYGKELLNIGGFDVKLNDIFVIKPKNRDDQKKKNRRSWIYVE